MVSCILQTYHTHIQKPSIQGNHANILSPFIPNVFQSNTICNISITRHQQWFFNNHQPFRKPSYFSNEIGSATLQTQARSMSSNQIQVMDATSIAPMRPSQFLEEKRWPPLEIMNSHPWKKRLPSNTESKSVLLHQFGSTTSPSLRPTELNFPNKTRFREHLSNSDEHRSYSNAFNPEFEPPFRIKVTSRLNKIWIAYILFLKMSFSISLFNLTSINWKLVKEN